MFPSLFARRRPAGLRLMPFLLPGILLLSLLVSACSGAAIAPTPSKPPGTTTNGGSSTFPTTAPQLRAASFAESGPIAPTVKVLPSVAPSRIIQFALFPASIKALFPKATALVTVVQGNPEISVFDTVIVDVQNMPPQQKFTVFFVESSSKPFGHEEYVGDVFARADGSGESVFHLITLVAFAADNRNPGTSNDQSGTASGVQLEHVGMWFDDIRAARRVFNDPTLHGTPFDGGNPPLHGGPQVLTDGQTLPVI